MSRAINFSFSKTKDLDALAACERLSRQGRGIEISPAYVAVALQRLSDMGLSPRLVE